MILTTPTKQPFTTTKHNHKSYIFTLYLFMLLCVVGNCLLFYCSCLGNCENCCGINGLLRIANIDQDGKVDGNKILNELFVDGKAGNNASVNVPRYIGSTGKDYNEAKEEFLKSITPTDETYLSAYVEVGDAIKCFIHCENANTIQDNDGNYRGLFNGSEATKIVILSCGNNITNMGSMFCYCENLLSLDLSNFNTKKVTNMSNMFYYCSKLTVLDLSNFNTTKVTNMYGMFSWCISLTNLNLSNFNTENVTNMSYMFYKCFQNKATLICQASTIKKITDKEDKNYSYLKFVNNGVKNDIENNNNPGKVYTCSVEREVKKSYEVPEPKITEIK